MHPPNPKPYYIVYIRAAAGIDLHVNPHKTEYVFLSNTLNGSSLKLVDEFTYQAISVASTETDINMWLAKAWAAIDS